MFYQYMTFYPSSIHSHIKRIIYYYINTYTQTALKTNKPKKIPTENVDKSRRMSTQQKKLTKKIKQMHTIRVISIYICYRIWLNIYMFSHSFFI